MSLIKSAKAYYHKHLHWGITRKIQKLFVIIFFSNPICRQIPCLNRIPVFIYLLTGPGQHIYASWKELVRDIIYVINIDGKTKLDWAERKNKLDRIYKDIRLYPLLNSSIGGEICEAVNIWHDDARRKDSDILYLYIANSKFGNGRLEKILGRTMNLMCNNEERFFWIYYILHLNKKIHNDAIISEWTGPLRWSVPRNEIRPSWSMQYIIMTDDEEREGEKKAREMGLTGTFVCISNRDPAYFYKLGCNRRVENQNAFRDSDINTRADAARYLSACNIQCVRMGAVVAKRADFPNCIDYANDFYDELMDVWLVRHCKFWVSDESGIDILPRTMNKRCVITNFTMCIQSGYSAVPLRDDSIYIIKRYKSVKDGRMLTLEEMAECDMILWASFSNGGDLDKTSFDRLGIEVVDNTAAEILDAVREMNERIDGTWTETAEDRELQDRFQNKLRDLQQKAGADMDATVIGLIGTQFLRDHMDLLDQVDSEFMHLCD